MIKMQNVRKTYPGFDFELSLEIPEGRITGLIGKNGAALILMKFIMRERLMKLRME